MLSKYVLPGNRMELRTIQRMRADGVNQPAKTYQTQVYDILSEERLEILMPMVQSKLVLLPIGGEYDVYFYTEKGLYQCYVKVVERYKKKNAYILAVELQTQLRRHQRRDYFRFSCSMPLQSRLLNPEEETAMKKKQDFLSGEELPLDNSIAVDISGGGLRFVADFAYKEEDLIYCRFHLPSGNSSKAYEPAGRVLNVREIENRKGMFEHRIQFARIKVEDREEIIHFIFEEERKKLKRGKYEK